MNAKIFTLFCLLLFNSACLAHGEADDHEYASVFEEYDLWVDPDDRSNDMDDEAGTAFQYSGIGLTFPFFQKQHLYEENGVPDPPDPPDVPVNGALPCLILLALILAAKKLG